MDAVQPLPAANCLADLRLFVFLQLQISHLVKLLMLLTSLSDECKLPCRRQQPPFCLMI